MTGDPGAPLLPEGMAVELPGRGITYVREVAGPAGSPVLVLLHGWTATAALNWYRSFGPLGRQFRVLALDHRGHGRGIRSRQPFRLEDCADDVAALAEALAIPRLIPVGYSMGGPVAALTWQRHRDLVQGLVLCATAPRFASHRRAERLWGPWLPGLSMAASLPPAALRQRVMARIVNNRYQRTEISRWAADELARNDPAALLWAGTALGTFDAGPWLGTIDVPTAVVVTEQDRIVPPAHQRALAKAIPGAEIFSVLGDHGACAADPPQFVATLVQACRSVARRSAVPAPRSAN